MQINFNTTFSNKVNFQASQTKKLINQERLVDSFIKMVKLETTSSADSVVNKVPSTDTQIEFAKQLKVELESMGLKNVQLDEHCILTATLESNMSTESPIVGLLAHYDTSEEASGKNVNPQFHKYKGGDIKLKDGILIEEKDLKTQKGKTVITSDGTTLLGADDKAGLAEILEAVKVLQENPHIKHPTIRIAFTPDEENGQGVHKFDIKSFGADIAYTIDSGGTNFIEGETFNAYNPEIIIKGKNVHPGYAYKKIINSIKVASWIISKLPAKESPERTRGKNGYFHVVKISGETEQTRIKMLVRDHDDEIAKTRLKYLQKIIREAEAKFKCKIDFNSNPVYKNMLEKINELPEVMEYAKEGISRSGLKPKVAAIRGGTDGSTLSLSGLLTPNLSAGGQNFHSKSEFTSVEDMAKCCENILNIIHVWAENSNKIMDKIRQRRQNQE